MRVTETFKYLEVKCTSTGESNDEIKTRLGQARAPTRHPKSMLWSNKITINNKIKMYKAIVECIGLYGAELWGINKRKKFKIDDDDDELLEIPLPPYWNR